jgi:F-type H+-transporting ATPase subunit b
VQIDWTTLSLEALNFLVLVWLLTRFFYRPVLNVIEARKAATAKAIAEAEALRRDAETLKAEYEGRLARLEAERAAARARIDADIAAERARRLKALDADVEAERRRRETSEAQRQRDREAALERQALALAARFATRLLDRLAGPELDARLADLALADLEALAPDKLDALSTALREPDGSVRIVSAYRLDEARRERFVAAFTRLAGRPVDPEFTEDPVLRAGVCVVVGSWVLTANLRDELGFFAGAFDHGD